MFRKIRSNRDPGKTVFAELYQQFRPYLMLLRRRMMRLLKTYPKQVFVTMVITLIFSVLYSFGVLRRLAEKEVKVGSMEVSAKNEKPAPTIEDGLSKISSTGNKLRKTIWIRKQVDSVLARERLDHRDTLFLESKLEELRQLR
jgi:aspartokinase